MLKKRAWYQVIGFVGSCRPSTAVSTSNPPALFHAVPFFPLSPPAPGVNGTLHYRCTRTCIRIPDYLILSSNLSSQPGVGTNNASPLPQDRSPLPAPRTPGRSLAAPAALPPVEATECCCDSHPLIMTFDIATALNEYYTVVLHISYLLR